MQDTNCVLMSIVKVKDSYQLHLMGDYWIVQQQFVQVNVLLALMIFYTSH